MVLQLRKRTPNPHVNREIRIARLSGQVPPQPALSLNPVAIADKHLRGDPLSIVKNRRGNSMPLPLKPDNFRPGPHLHAQLRRQPSKRLRNRRHPALRVPNPVLQHEIRNQQRPRRLAPIALPAVRRKSIKERPQQRTLEHPIHQLLISLANIKRQSKLDQRRICQLPRLFIWMREH